MGCLASDRIRTRTSMINPLGCAQPGDETRAAWWNLDVSPGRCMQSLPDGLYLLFFTMYSTYSPYSGGYSILHTLGGTCREGGEGGARCAQATSYSIYIFFTPSFGTTSVVVLPKRGVSERTHEPCTSRNSNSRPKYKCHDKSSPSAILMLVPQEGSGMV